MYGTIQNKSNIECHLFVYHNQLNWKCFNTYSSIFFFFVPATVCINVWSYWWRSSIKLNIRWIQIELNSYTFASTHHHFPFLNIIQIKQYFFDLMYSPFRMVSIQAVCMHVRVCVYVPAQTSIDYLVIFHTIDWIANGFPKLLLLLSLLLLLLLLSIVTGYLLNLYRYSYYYP